MALKIVLLTVSILFITACDNSTDTSSVCLSQQVDLRLASTSSEKTEAELRLLKCLQRSTTAAMIRNGG